MEYACVLDNIDEKYILPDFANTIFKAGESNIDVETGYRCNNVVSDY